MNEQEKTPWFDGVSPVHIGPYETTNDESVPFYYQHWDGKDWGYCARHPSDCLPASTAKSISQSPKWRGLCKQTFNGDIHENK